MRFNAVQKPTYIPRVSKTGTVPAPIKGINAYDSIANMPDGFALLLRNLFAQPYGCQVRRGYVRHVGGLGNWVETVMSHNKLVPKLYAAVDTFIYDVTTPNDVAPPVVRSGRLNARWQHINFPNAAGVSMVAVNGADDMLWFKPDGTYVDVSVGAGVNQINGVDPKVLIDVYAHQKRLWFVQKNTTQAWYLPPDQITGNATAFDFGPNWTRGGYLNQIITWTIDDGNGADDHLAAISTEGEVSVYVGTDASSTTDWRLQGVYFAGAPVGRRAATRYGGDILMVTELGLVLLSDLLKSTKVNPTEGNFGRYIQQIISSLASDVGDQYGWQPFIFPGANMVIINVPTDDNTNVQYIMNDITKGWSQFVGYNGRSWELHQQIPVFGGFGAVYRAWEGNTDGALLLNDGTVVDGAEIRSEAQPGFNYFGSGPLTKNWKMVRPVILSSSGFNMALTMNSDFEFGAPVTPGFHGLSSSGVWDEDVWDGALWAGGLVTTKDWVSVGGLGAAGSLRILLRTTGETYWASTDYILEDGGIMG